MLGSSMATMVKSFLTKHVDCGLVGAASSAALPAALLPRRAGGSIDAGWGERS